MHNDITKLADSFRVAAEAITNLFRPFLGRLADIFGTAPVPLPPRAAAQFAAVFRGRYHGARKRAKAMRRAGRLARAGL